MKILIIICIDFCVFQMVKNPTMQKLKYTYHVNGVLHGTVGVLITQ